MPTPPTTTRYLLRPEGRLAYDVNGDIGPLVLCVPGMGDLRAEYRFLAKGLTEAGFRVATLDVRGHGESDVTFSDYSASAVGADIAAWLENQDEKAFVVGTSMAAAAAVWAAAEVPSRVRGLVLAGPFVRDVPANPLLTLLLRVLLWPLWGRAFWMSYFPAFYPTRKPPDFEAYKAALRQNLNEPGRFAALRAMAKASKRACEARIVDVTAPTLVVMGTKDPDFANPAKEAQHVAECLRGSCLLVDGAGHYPHAEMPDVVLPRVVSFLREVESHAQGRS